MLGILERIDKCGERDFYLGGAELISYIFMMETLHVGL